MDACDTGDVAPPYDNDLPDTPLPAPPLSGPGMSQLCVCVCEGGGVWCEKKRVYECKAGYKFNYEQESKFNELI